MPGTQVAHQSDASRHNLLEGNDSRTRANSPSRENSCMSGMLVETLLSHFQTNQVLIPVLEFDAD